MALDLGHGGIKLVCEIFDINPISIRTGIKELKENEELPFDKVGKTGGGRKKNSVGN
jgi:hypothetical protein